jgi:Homeodomain-like domain
MSQVIEDGARMITHVVEGTPGDHSCRRGETIRSAGRSRLRRVSFLVYELLTRYRAEGDAAYQPRSRRPKRSPRATPPATVELVLRLRKQLLEAGLDAGADTIAWHLRHHDRVEVSRATIHRILTRHGAVTPEPAKRPRSSYIRFEANQPNQCWQSDFTHYRLADGRHVEIITWLDDLRLLVQAAPGVWEQRGCRAGHIGRTGPHHGRVLRELTGGVRLDGGGLR